MLDGGASSSASSIRTSPSSLFFFFRLAETDCSSSFCFLSDARFWGVAVAELAGGAEGDGEIVS